MNGNNTLSVSDVERLAKAGVKIDFDQIAEQIMRDNEPVPLALEVTDHPQSLMDSFWQRWQRANPRQVYSDGLWMPWTVYASEFGDKVYVFVAPTDAEPFILEDDKHLYPSDALMAKLHLREKTK